MRRSLFTAAAVAPLALLAGAPALAETHITDARTQPVNTSTINNGQPDDLTIDTGGSVKPTTSGAAVTLDSNNVLNNGGAIATKNVDNSTGVLILGGHTGSFVNNGSITISEDYQAKDTNSDGVLDGVFAQGTGRYGVRLTGPGAFTGGISISSTGSIVVQGNNSYGISLEAPLIGDLIQQGGIALTGDHTFGIRATDITGKVNLANSLNATGAGAVAAEFDGNITGRLTVYGTLAATGYRATQRNPDPALNNKLLPEDLQQSGSALLIKGDVLGGVFVGAPPAGTVATDTTTDADGDGVVDSVESIGRVAVIGSAPAMVVGSTGRDVHLGAFGTGDNAYGLIIRGGLSGAGVFDGRSAAGLQIGTGDGTVHIDGGLRNVGAIAASSAEEDSLAVRIESGAVVPQFRNEGQISAEVTSARASNAIGVFIDGGASSSSLLNSGVITTSLTGNLGSAYGFVDRSGTVSTVVNTNAIRAIIAPATSTGVALGRAVALDLSSNTSGVSLVQSANTSTSITSTITGDILLGSGDDTVAEHAGNIDGALSFGAGSGSLTVDGGASYQGAITAQGPLALSVSNGVLEDHSPTTLQVSSLNVGSQGVLGFSADPANNRATLLQVAGPATIASGAALSLNLQSLPFGAQSYVVVSSPNLTVASGANLTATAPYLFVANFRADQTAGAITLDLRRRTATEASLNSAEAAAYDPVYFGLTKDAGIQRAFLAQTTQGGLTGVLNQMLPDHAGGVFRALSWAAEAQADAAAQNPLGQEQAGPTRAWTNEIVVHEQKDMDQALGYRLLGFGAVGGLESVSQHGDALGFRLGFIAANVRNPDLASANLLGVSELNAGVYWRGSFGGGLKADAQVAGGYMWAYGRREFLFSDSTGVVHRATGSRWGGYTLSGRLGLRYVATAGRAFFEPQVHLDYFRVHEGGYTEHGGGSGFDMRVGSRSGDALTVTSTLTAGVEWGTGFRWRPQIQVGYRAMLAGSAGDTPAELASGGSSFLLAAESIRSGAFLANAGLRIYSDYLDLLLSGGAEVTDEYTDIDVRLTARTVF